MGLTESYHSRSGAPAKSKSTPTFPSGAECRLRQGATLPSCSLRQCDSLVTQKDRLPYPEHTPRLSERSSRRRRKDHSLQRTVTSFSIERQKRKSDPLLDSNPSVPLATPERTPSKHGLNSPRCRQRPTAIYISEDFPVHYEHPAVGCRGGHGMISSPGHVHTLDENVNDVRLLPKSVAVSESQVPKRSFAPSGHRNTPPASRARHQDRRTGKKDAPPVELYSSTPLIEGDPYVCLHYGSSLLKQEPGSRRECHRFQEVTAWSASSTPSSPRSQRTQIVIHLRNQGGSVPDTTHSLSPSNVCIGSNVCFESCVGKSDPVHSSVDIGPGEVKAPEHRCSEKETCKDCGSPVKGSLQNGLRCLFCSSVYNVLNYSERTGRIADATGIPSEVISYPGRYSPVNFSQEVCAPRRSPGSSENKSFLQSVEPPFDVPLGPLLPPALWRDEESHWVTFDSDSRCVQYTKGCTASDLSCQQGPATSPSLVLRSDPPSAAQIPFNSFEDVSGDKTSLTFPANDSWSPGFPKDSGIGFRERIRSFDSQEGFVELRLPVGENQPRLIDLLMRSNPMPDSFLDDLVQDSCGLKDAPDTSNVLKSSTIHLELSGCDLGEDAACGDESCGFLDDLENGGTIRIKGTLQSDVLESSVVLRGTEASLNIDERRGNDSRKKNLTAAAAWDGVGGTSIVDDGNQMNPGYGGAAPYERRLVGKAPPGRCEPLPSDEVGTFEGRLASCFRLNEEKTDCHFTCHEVCQDVVSVDCHVCRLEDGRGDAEDDQEIEVEDVEDDDPEMTSLSGEDDDEDDEVVQKGDEDEQGGREKHEAERQEKELSGGEGTLLSEPSSLRRAVKGLRSEMVNTQDLEDWVQRCSSLPEGLRIAREPDGTVRGCIRVQLNLNRPINIVAGTRPPSIYDILQEDESLEKTLTSFYMPRDTVKAVHVTSKTTTREVIAALLKKFKVVDNPQKFALYERLYESSSCTKSRLRRLLDSECPLVLVMGWTAQGHAHKRLVLQENDTADIQWDAFTLPELSNFLQILDREEEDYKWQIKEKYALLKEKITQYLAQPNGNHPSKSNVQQ